MAQNFLCDDILLFAREFYSTFPVTEKSRGQVKVAGIFMFDDWLTVSNQIFHNIYVQ